MFKSDQAAQFKEIGEGGSLQREKNKANEKILILTVLPDIKYI